jgi:hypothetical protein
MKDVNILKCSVQPWKQCRNFTYLLCHISKSRFSSSSSSPPNRAVAVAIEEPFVEEGSLFTKNAMASI